ncbi:hypothetical protein QZH41_012280, partial [Actinostola sp. cb2023]
GSCCILLHQERILAERKRIHTTVFDVAFSPCGNFFAACNNFGSIAVFSLSSALAPDADYQSRKPIFTFEAQSQSAPIYTLLSTDTFLISGGSSEITGWRWDDILEMVGFTTHHSNNASSGTQGYIRSLVTHSQRNTPGNESTGPSWTLSPPSSAVGVPETNAIAYDKENNTLLSGCGDNNIYSWDLEIGTRKELIFHSFVQNTFTGHADYVQSLALRSSSNECLSGSEDGSVRFWDCRSGSMTNMVEPYKDKNLNRPKFGKWIGCVALDSNEEWMVCGGGPRLSVWHLRSLTCTGVLDTPNSSQQNALFHEDTIITSGTEPSVFHWQVNGELRSQIPCTASCAYAMRINSASPQKKVSNRSNT